jgi:haloacid dehalogenase superfamily, subfamily IA, variant 3 with third motif having DD or ED/haloacid dehalogenase superfamily, subfamily IA, variant 1 with third motif having Dx(3-4)D or Dx(3-4)E
MKYKAIFFDRDGTLVHGNPEKILWRNETIASWSGKPFELDYEKWTALFKKANNGRNPWYQKTVEDEKALTKRYYYHLLIGEGISEKLDLRAHQLFDAMWHENNPPIPYPETVEVLEYFYSQGYKMGVISDTSPSLQLTLEKAGIAHYFTSFTASSLVGAMKPDPIIFNAALRAQNVTANESLYVDDYDAEADGARKLGFTSFLIDREDENKSPFAIKNLKEMIAYVEAKV